MNRLLHHLRGNAVAYLALFVALGGTSYAAVRIPDNSVGNAQIKNDSIQPVKLNTKYIGGEVRAWARVNAAGHVIGGGHGIVVTPQGEVPGVYLVSPKKDAGVLPTRCAILTSVDYNAPAPGYAEAQLGVASTESPKWQATISTYNGQGQQAALPFDFAIIC